jgi:multiple sugar transport system substrate-binding protein
MSKEEKKPENVSRRSAIQTVGGVVVGLAVGAAAGWLGKPTPPSEMTTITETMTERATVTATAAPPPVTTAAIPTLPRYDGVVLNVVAQPWEGFFGAMADPLVDFQKKTGMTVNITYYPEVERRAKIRMDAATKTGSFQIYYVDEAITPELASGGSIVPLKDYYPPEYDISDFAPAYLGVLTYKGVVYGCPFRGGTDLLFYRKDLFDAETPAYPVPKDMDALKEAAKHFTRAPDLYGITLRGQRGFGANVWLWQEYAAAFGGKYFDDSGKPVFNSPECVEATKLYTELIRSYGPPGGAVYTWADLLNAFQVGKVAMFTGDWDWMMNVEDPTKSSVAGKVGYSTFPTGPAGQVGNCGGHGLAMSTYGCKNETERKAAGLFIAWMTGKEAELHRIGTSVGFLTIARLSSINSPQFAAAVGPHPDWVSSLASTLKVASPKMPAIPEWPQIGDYLGICLEELFTGKRSDVKAALDDAVAYAVKVLAGTA